MKLAQKVAIVTGATQGIGLACAQRLLSEGARVMLVDIKADGAAAADALGADARFFAADVSQKADVDAMMAATLAEFGRVDILVNNAGVTHAADFLDLCEDDFDRVMRINLKSMFLCGQAVARQLVKQAEGGCIINMSSVNSELAIPNQVPYVVSKGGINQLTKVMALNLAPHGIRVNGISPGVVDTPMWGQVDALFARHEHLQPGEKKIAVGKAVPLGRMGTPQDIVGAAVFLANAESAYITAQTLNVDGGNVMS